MLAYCDNQSNLSHPWLKEGFSPCFFGTLSSSMFAAFAVLCGGVQIYVYRKYAVRIESVVRRPKPSLDWLYRLQLVLVALACIEPVVRLVLQLTVIRHGEIYGYVKAAVDTIIRVVNLREICKNIIKSPEVITSNFHSNSLIFLVPC